MEVGDHSMADPLLAADGGPRDASGELVRAPLGNSAWTLLLFVLVLAAGAGYWWWQRPSDLAQQLGGREWVITHVDGEPLGAERELVSMFVLDGTGEVRAMRACNTQMGTWEVIGQTARLEIEWGATTLVGCGDWPPTFAPFAGDASVENATLRLDSGHGTMTAVALAELPLATADEMVGEWVSRGRVVEFGRRGLFRVDECRGEWRANGDPPSSISFVMSTSEIDREQCELDRLWLNGGPLVPVLHDGSLFLRREASMFPLDRDTVRLDPATPTVGG